MSGSNRASGLVENVPTTAIRNTHVCEFEDMTEVSRIHKLPGTVIIQGLNISCRTRDLFVSACSPQVSFFLGNAHWI